jgi:predicted dehydrogenase
MKKLAMIGCGGIGAYHFLHLAQMTDKVELAGFCDLIPEKAQAFCEQAESGKAYTDYKVMYDEVQPDMVFICIPPYCHGEVEFETIRRGIHFFVEKPISLDLTLSREILRRVKEAGLITAVGFQCRYSNLIDPLQAFIERNPIALVEASRIGGIPDISWWPKKETCGGMLTESTIHQVDIIRYVFDEPVSVFTRGAAGWVDMEGYDMEDLTTTLIEFRSGALGVLSSGCYALEGASFDSKITFSGRNARAEHKIIDSLTVYEKQADADGDEGSQYVIKGDGALSKGADCRGWSQDGDAGMLCDGTFVDAVLSGDASKIRSPYEDALKSLAVTLACEQSMKRGQPLKVEAIDA